MLEAVAAPNARVLLATRDGRRGVAEFVELMGQSEVWDEEEVVPMASSVLDLPPAFEQHAERWHAHHSIYVYRKRQVLTSDVCN